MLTGDLDVAETQIAAVLEHSGNEPMYLAGYAMQSMWLRTLQGRLDEVISIAALPRDAVPEDSVFRVAVPLFAQVETGDVDGTRATLAAAGDDPISLVQPDW